MFFLINNDKYPPKRVRTVLKDFLKRISTIKQIEEYKLEEIISISAMPPTKIFLDKITAILLENVLAISDSDLNCNGYIIEASEKCPKEIIELLEEISIIRGE